jgi:hypothetical protein
VVPFGGLKNIFRAYLIILPFLIILATLGAEKLCKTRKPKSNSVFVICSGLVALIILLENIPLPLPIQQSRMMRPLSGFNQNVYHQLPFRQNRIILEIPFYFRLGARNSKYLLNWKFHQNYLLNGKTSIKSPDYIVKLKSIIGGMQKKFPDRFMLKALIERYSVDHVVFHWELLSRYHKNPNVRTKILKRIESIPDFCRVVYDSETATIIRIGENMGIRSIKRCYSLAHLKRCRLKTILAEPYSGEVAIYLNNRLIEKRAVNDTVFVVNLSGQKLEIPGNKIEFMLSEPVVLSDIQLIE